MFEMFEDNTYFYIVTEFLDGRDALDILHQRKVFTDEQAFDIFYQALLALNYLHQNNVMHRYITETFRDVKLENIIYN